MIATAPPSLCRLTLVLGGARSGKSHHAENIIESSGLNPVYIATAEARDAEMTRRIAQHQRRRSARWQTVDAPLELAAALRQESAIDRAILVDCLTLWLSNLMGANRMIEAEIGSLLACLAQCPGPIVLVSNEVGLGVVPANALARAFIDHAGFLHQALASRADRVLFITAGIARQLKP